MEAAIWGLPGVAVSLQNPQHGAGKMDFAPAAQIAQQVVRQLLRESLPKGILLNVNVPALPADQIRGIQVTRQGLRIYNDALVKRLDPRSRPYYWIGGEAPTGVIEDGTDYGALMAGYVSVTPIQLDLTAHAFLDTLRGWGSAWEQR
jgi:5'-nucleotidase